MTNEISVFELLYSRHSEAEQKLLERVAVVSPVFPVLSQDIQDSIVNNLFGDFLSHE